MRRFEFHEASGPGPGKFWAIGRDGCDLTIHWGRIGTEGHQSTRSFATDASAASERTTWIAAKVADGWVPAEAPPPAKRKPAAEAKPAPKRAAKPTPTKPSTKPEATPPIDPEPAVASLADIEDGGSLIVDGSGSSKYTLKNIGGMYSCTCPAWMHQSLAIDRRTCKHLRRLRGDAAETARVGAALPQRAVTKTDGTTNAPPLLLAHRWEDQDPTGWWLSEKLDGVRAYWDGKQFISRLGNSYMAPEWFIEGLPDFPLDGELFAGRKRFQHAVSVARRSDKGELWKTLNYVIFDAPALESKFEDRIRHLEDHFNSRPVELIRVLEHRVCNGVDDLRVELSRVEQLGGEGVMLRRPGSRYVAGRSDTLLKVKSFLDTEALVLGYQAGTGRHKGRLGAFLVQLADGTKFKVGTGMSDAERDDPAEVGSVITVRYQELTDAGVPRFPTYVGVRDDVDWDALVAAVCDD